jgi:hypothetical protein
MTSWPRAPQSLIQRRLAAYPGDAADIRGRKRRRQQEKQGEPFGQCIHKLTVVVLGLDLNL